MRNDAPRFFPSLATASLALLLLAAAAGAQEGRDPDAPDDLLQPPADAERTPSGLISKVLRDGTGDVHPDANDVVVAHYTGWTPYGAKFESSYDRGQPASFELARLAGSFPGWIEGLALMVVGEKRRLWIPAALAPPNPREGPRGAVVFDVELLGIDSVPNMPVSLEEPPADAEQTASGSFTRRIAEGTGEERPGPDDVALLDWTGWTKEGETFGSTRINGRPTAFPLDKVMAPFADAVRLMVVGEKRQIWIPADLAAGQFPGAPRGMLIFEVELLRILPPDVFQAGVDAATGEPGSP
jgi:peptidylprolyl isomerase